MVNLIPSNDPTRTPGTFTTVFVLFTLFLLPRFVLAEPERKTDSLATLEKSDYFKLRVHDQARVIRTVLPDLSPRSMAVGLPDGLSYAFDTKNAVVAYAWTGNFLDMSGIRKGRGRYNTKDERRRLRQFAHPSGDRFNLQTPKHQPLRIGDPNAQPDVQFLGYKNSIDALPVLLYKLGDIQVEHRVRMQSKDPIRLAYEYRLSPAPEQTVYFVSKRQKVTVLSEKTNSESVRIPAKQSGSFTVELKVGTDQ